MKASIFTRTALIVSTISIFLYFTEHSQGTFVCIECWVFLQHSTSIFTCIKDPNTTPFLLRTLLHYIQKVHIVLLIFSISINFCVFVDATCFCVYIFSIFFRDFSGTLWPVKAYQPVNLALLWLARSASRLTNNGADCKRLSGECVCVYLHYRCLLCGVYMTLLYEELID